MQNNNWIEEFDEQFDIQEMMVSQKSRALLNIRPSFKPNLEIKNFISNLLTKKDQEHKAELKEIRDEIEKKIKPEPHPIDEYVANQFAVEYN